MNRIWLTMIASALMTIAAIAPVVAQDTITIDMREVDGSGQSGNADITTDGEQVIVAIEIDAGEEGVAQPAHIHEGTCDDLGDVAFPLDDVVDGVSESTADVPMSELLPTEYAINVHLSEDQMDVHVACGNLPQIGGAPSDDAAADEDGESDDTATDDEATDEGTDDTATDAEATDEGTDDTAADDTAADDGEGDTEDATDDAQDDTATEDTADDIVPATGSGGPGAEAGIALMLVLAGGAVGAGVLVRRRALQA